MPFRPPGLGHPDCDGQIKAVRISARIRHKRHPRLGWSPVPLAVVARYAGRAKVQRVVGPPSRPRDNVVERQGRGVFHSAAVLAAIAIAEENADAQFALALVLANVDVDFEPDNAWNGPCEPRRSEDTIAIKFDNVDSSAGCEAQRSRHADQSQRLVRCVELQHSSTLYFLSHKSSSRRPAHLTLRTDMADL